MTEQDHFYLRHIAERIARIEKATGGGWEAFADSEIVQDAVIRNFDVIGEAVKRLGAAPAEAYPHVPWRSIARFRDVLIHHYIGVDLRQVWNVVEHDLPALKKAVQAMLGG